MNHSNRIIIAACLLALTGFVIYFIYSYRQSHPSLKLSPLEKGKPINFDRAKKEKFIFGEEKPVYSVYGRVDNISGNTIQLTMQVITPTNYNPANIRTYVPFIIHIDKTTDVSHNLQTVKLIYSKIQDYSMPALSLSEIKLGNYLTAYSSDDLRNLQTPEFTAVKLELPQIRNVIEGRISDVSGKQLTVSRTPFAQPWNPGENRMLHIVTVNDKTEISHTNESGSNQRDSFSDLKPGMRVRVYSFEDIEETDHLTAMRVEPLPALVIASPAPVVTPK